MRKQITSGTDEHGNGVTIEPGQRFKLAKRPDLVYVLDRNGAHHRVMEKPRGKDRRAARRQGRTL